MVFREGMVFLLLLFSSGVVGITTDGTITTVAMDTTDITTNDVKTPEGTTTDGETTSVTTDPPTIQENLLPPYEGYPTSECITCGYINQYTFDNRSYEVSSLGATAESYYLISGDELPFEISLHRWFTPAYEESHSSLLVTFNANRPDILLRGTDVFVDDISVFLPLVISGADDDSYLYLHESGGQTIIHTSSGEVVYYDQRGGWAVISLPVNEFGNFANLSTNGLCGTLNGNELDDFTSAAGEIEQKQNFLTSWAISPDDTPYHNCIISETEPDECSIISDTTGPFKDCLDVSNIDYYKESCRVEVSCGSSICGVLSSFAHQCQREGFPISEWRTDAGCILNCPTNAEYRINGPFCPDSCPTLLGQQKPATCYHQSGLEGCYCRTGFLWNGNECTQDGECGCLINGYYYKINEEVLLPECDRLCTCNADGTVTCIDVSCAEGRSSCVAVDRSHQCVCNIGYKGDGFTCAGPCEVADPFECPDGTCIGKSSACDGILDCSDGYDESKAYCCDEELNNQYCPKVGYERCPNGIYIEEEKFCDGWENDCVGNYDERDELCATRCTYTTSSRLLLIDPVRGTYDDGESISFKCQAGYTLVGDSTRTCSNQEWSGDDPVCYANCKAPNSPNNGQWNSSATELDHGDALSVNCNLGFESNTNEAIICDDGKTTATTIQCEDINECDTISCNYGSCINQKNSYSCLCDEGYEGDHCDENIDYCAMSNACDENASCTDGITSVTCECKDGFSGDGYFCSEDIYLPFGIANGDEQLTQTASIISSRGTTILDLASDTIRPTTGFPLGSEFYYSLYIVDNGLIVFTKESEDKLVYSYPYPEFTGKEDIMCVAPFWADAIINKNIGEVYYHIYDRREMDDSELLDEISSRVNEQNLLGGTTFTATWALIVTWYNMQALGSPMANTYQAVITTDSQYSFALFNYEEGKMAWNYFALPNKNVIIGYSQGNGQGFENAHSDWTVDQKFRPDQQEGNTGKQGRWIYRLESNDGNVINSKQICLDWYDSETDPTRWTSLFDPCPCSYNQAFRDRRYSWAYRAYSVNYEYGIPEKWKDKVGPNFERDLQNAVYYELCMQPTLPFPSWWFFFPNPFWWGWGFYKGNMCCYRYYDYSLIRGYGSEFESSVAERYMFNLNFYATPTNYDSWFDNDLMPRHHCCALSGDEAFCNYYLEKRPPVQSCNGYRPPRWSWMFRDPHFTTLDGFQYTFNGLGEYTMARFVHPNGTGEEIFHLQGRTATLIDENGEVTNATYFSAFAAQFLNSSKVEMVLTTEDGDDIEVYINDELFNQSLLVDGAPYTDGGEEGTFQLSRANSTEKAITGSWSSGFSITVEIASSMLEVILSAPEEYSTGISAGLLGVWNGDEADDLRRKDGDLQTKDGENYTESELFQFGETWRVLEEESLFGYQNGSYSEFNQQGFVPFFLDDLASQTKAEDEVLYESIINTCDGNTECLYDGFAAKSENVSADTKLSSEELELGSKTLENFPPNVTGDAILQAVINQAVSYVVEVEETVGDTYTLSLIDPPIGASINQDGVLIWTPTEKSKVSIIIQATDASNGSSVLQPVIKLCDCENGICTYEAYVDGSNVVEDKFAVVVCECSPGYTGGRCDENYDACQDSPCYTEVPCFDSEPPSDGFSCGPCPPGLEGDGEKCHDFDECTAWANRTEEEGGPACNHICTNTEGSFACSCFSEGYELGADQRTCIDIDECETGVHGCSPDANCDNTEGSYNCTCNTGYRGDGNTCDEINECEENTDECDPSADCTNIAGSYQCECIPGYEGDGKSCQNIDECRDQLDDCGDHATCTDAIGSYSCSCDVGFEGDGRECTDINECDDEAFNACHYRANCSNTEGSYICMCEAGFTQDGQFSCKDIDECLLGKNDCDVHADCINVHGSFDCRCSVGFSGDGRTCNDINECALTTLPCSTNATCTNSIGSYFCTCDEGYVGDGISCTDENECQTNKHDCNETFSYCVNTEGSFQCDCSRGYRPNPSGDRNSCVDFDECDEESDNCDQICTNTIGGFQCSCAQGYQPIILDPNLCEDIDECALDIHKCDQLCNNTNMSPENPLGYNCGCNEVFNLTDSFYCIPAMPCDDLSCTNGLCYLDDSGNPQCACLRGYEPDENSNSTCKDIDECASTDTHQCRYKETNSPATCENTNGTYSCSCQSGFILNPADNRTCEDENECTESTNECNLTSTTCFNLVGSYECKCLSGFDNPDGKKCTDIDECNQPNDCHEYANCDNTVGSYECECKEGFTGNGLVCTDINECAANDSICVANSVCSNTIGWYHCNCSEGYEGNAKTECTDIDECENVHDCSENANCTNTEGSYDCACLDGYDGDGRLCYDIDECVVPTTCSDNAICTNLNGTFSCECYVGFTGDGFVCADIDECASPDTCPENSVCDNIEGSFKCTCVEGYRSNGTDLCEDIDECAGNFDACSSDASCTNTIGNYTCACNDGYTGDGFECIDVNECDGENDCHVFADCRNTNGSFTCNCQDGYQTVPGESTGRNCENINECELGIDKCDRVSQNCIDTVGSYDCTCKEGFTEDNAGNCEDINECDDKPCQGENTRCINSVGNYSCECRTGYQEQNGACLATIYETLEGNFTIIQGIAVTASYFEKDNLETYREGVQFDMDQLFTYSLLPSYTSISVTDQVYMTDTVFYTFALEFEPGTDLEVIDILDVFLSYLGGTNKNEVPPDNVVFPDSFTVGMYVADPCVEQTDDCQPNSICVSTGPPDYECVCKEGYEGEGKISCTDMNECEDDPCSINEVCTNQPGSFLCECDIENGFVELEDACTEMIVMMGRLNIYKVNGIEVTYTDALKDHNGPEYVILNDTMCSVLSVTLRGTDFGEDLIGCTVEEFSPGSNILSVFYLFFGITSTVSSSELENQFEDIIVEDNWVMDNTINNVTIYEEDVDFFDWVSHIECENSSCNWAGNCSVVNKTKITCNCFQEFRGEFCEVALPPEVTTPVLTTTTTTSLPEGVPDIVIIFSALGGFLFILLLVLIIIYCYRKNHHQPRSNSISSEGYAQPDSSYWTIIQDIQGGRKVDERKGDHDVPLTNMAYENNLPEYSKSIHRDEYEVQELPPVSDQMEEMNRQFAGPSDYYEAVYTEVD